MVDRAKGEYDQVRSSGLVAWISTLLQKFLLKDRNWL